MRRGGALLSLVSGRQAGDHHHRHRQEDRRHPRRCRRPRAASQTPASPLLPSSVKAAASSRLATSSPSPSASAGKTTAAPRATARPLWGTSSSSSVKAPWLARSPTRFAGKSAPRLASAIRTPGATSSSSSVKAASSACRSAGKTATPPVRGSRRPSKIQEAKSRRLRDGRNSSEIRKKELTEGRDAAATVAARVLQEASIFDSLLRNESEFSEICNSAKVSDPLPIVDAFLSVYEDTIQWNNITESVASVEISSAKYWVGGVPHLVHELSLPNAPKTKSTAKERTAELAKNLCGQMQTWFLDFVEEALDVENKWKHSSDTSTLLSQFEKISDWLEQIHIRSWRRRRRSGPRR
ncbi:collagen alpha-1(XXVII) chain [Sorghum bicolor]|uniref:collagen alpha-1(XXVII) chain n=1 Tax=Sorghum bicolor TaxID=4558 RepID=UPI000B423D99|nr:collagen alpha-1(XXVII) chain [Sorghum bicolor]|eukprot:XP_002450162.2 collagen alpha-1(XXVII) chain [Sorghum bicolor]